MGNQTPGLIWTLTALRQFQEQYNYIRKDSPANADKVWKAVVDRVNELVVHPEKYPPDRFRRNRNSAYRAFEKCKLRVTYRLAGNKVIIIRIRHTRQSPQYY